MLPQAESANNAGDRITRDPWRKPASLNMVHMLNQLAM